MDSLWLVLPSGRTANGGWIDDTLKQRAAETGLTRRLDLAGNFPRVRVEVVRGDDAHDRVNELFYRRGWTDGLPIVPPTTDRVAAMLRQGSLGANDSLGPLEPLLGEATAEKLAANAVMAGCLPEHFPVLLAAVEAIADPQFNLRGVQTTDENVTPCLVVNGPIAARLDINASFGVLGPGWRANATIGRALRLVMHNIGGGWPVAVSFAGLGQAARYSLCVAENAAQSPWPPLHVELGFPLEASTVTVTRAESVINVTGGLEEIASVMASAASNFARLHSGHVVVLLAPDTARRLAAQGLDKADVKRQLHQNARMPAEAFEASWLYRDIGKSVRWPAWVTAALAEGAVPPVEAPEDISIVVAGGDIPIAQHAYLPSWGFPTCRLTKVIHG